MFPYFVSGYLFNKYSYSNKIAELKSPTLIGLSIVLVLLYIGLYFNFKNDYYIYKTGTCILTHKSIDFYKLYIDIYRYTIGAIGSVSVLLIQWLFITKKIVKKSWLTSLIVNIGRRSLGIYIISEPFLNMLIIKKLPHKQYLGIVAIIIETVFVLFITCCITFLIERNRFISRYLLGR